MPRAVAGPFAAVKKCARFQQGAMLTATQLLEDVCVFTSKARLSASVDEGSAHSRHQCTGPWCGCFCVGAILGFPADSARKRFNNCLEMLLECS